MRKLTQNKHLNCRVNVDAEKVATTCSNEVPVYDVAEFMELKNRLNIEKTNQDAWSMGVDCPNYLKISLNLDLYKALRFTAMDNFGAQLVTNAWLKYYEIYLHYKLIPEGVEFKAFCNAELPGSSICALNHIVRTMRGPNLAFDWRASSLVLGSDRTEQLDALGDHYGIWARNKDKWLMTVTPPRANDTAGVIEREDVSSIAAPGEPGYINNGDATDYNNILDYEARIGPSTAFGGVHLYSHDAGIDVTQVNPESGEAGYNEQEILDARIHLGCAIAGFCTLRYGGNFVAKQYTYFESLTHNLILIYASLFDKFYLCKPLTSKPYNSEIYLIGIGFRGFDDRVRKVLVERLANFNVAPFFTRADLPPIADILRFARLIFGQQIEFLKEKVEYYKLYCKHIGGFVRSLDGLKRDKQNAWLRAYPMKRLARADMLPSDKIRNFKE